MYAPFACLCRGSSESIFLSWVVCSVYVAPFTCLIFIFPKYLYAMIVVIYYLTLHDMLQVVCIFSFVFSYFLKLPWLILPQDIQNVSSLLKDIGRTDLCCQMLQLCIQSILNRVQCPAANVFKKLILLDILLDTKSCPAAIYMILQCSATKICVSDVFQQR